MIGIPANIGIRLEVFVDAREKKITFQRPIGLQYIGIIQRKVPACIIGNVLRVIIGGLYMGLGWWLAGILRAITIVGLPWARACFVIGLFAILAFGNKAVSRDVLSVQEAITSDY